MLNDLNYDLVETISIISKSLDRYQTYMKDSADCRTCQDIWNKIRHNREEELQMLVQELKRRVQEGEFFEQEKKAA